MAWLRNDDRDRVRAEVAAGYSQAEVARRWELAESTVSRIVRRVDRNAPPAKVIPKDQIQVLQVERLMTVPEIATTLKVGEDFVRRSLRRHRMPLVSDAWLRQRYVEAGRTIAELAAEAGCHPAVIRRYMITAGISRRRTGYRSTIDAAAVLAAIDAGETNGEVSRRVGIAHSTVSKIVRERRRGTEFQHPGGPGRTSILGSC